MSKRRPRPLERLPLDAGLRRGAWSVWRSEPEELLLVHAAGAWAARLYVPSNGWFDFRARPNRWHTAWSNGSVGEDGGRFEEEVVALLAREAAAEWPEGEYAAGQWRVAVAADRVTVAHPRNEGRLVLFTERPLWTWCKKPPAAGRDGGEA